jgi:hypothetical protein
MPRLFCVIDCAKPVSPSVISYITDSLKKKSLEVSIFVNNKIHRNVKVIADGLLETSDGSVTLFGLLENVLKYGETSSWADEDDTAVLIALDEDRDQVSNLTQIRELVKQKRLDDWAFVYNGPSKINLNC